MSKKKYKNKKIVVCKTVTLLETETIYYEYDARYKDIFIPGNYILKIRVDKDSIGMEGLYVENIIDNNRLFKLNCIDENTIFKSTDKKLLFEVNEQVYSELINSNLKKYKICERKLFKILKIQLFLEENFTNQERVEYLVNTYYSNPSEFDKFNKNDRKKWLEDINYYELSVYNEINLCLLYRTILKSINDSNIITNIDKVALEQRYKVKYENEFYAILPKELAHRQMNNYVEVDIDEDTKEIIWGRYSPCEIRIDFSFFWSLVKSILSLTYIPAIFLLLEEESKIIIYILLAVVYLITLIFADEKNLGKLLEYLNKRKIKVGYRMLYYWGMKISIIFILFSVEMVLGNINGYMSLIKYFFVNYVIAFSLIISLNLILSLFVWLITRLSATPFYRKKWERVRYIIKNCFTLGIFIVGLFFCYEIFNIKNYFIEDVQQLDKILVLFTIILLFPSLKVILVIYDLYLYIKDMKK